MVRFVTDAGAPDALGHVLCLAGRLALASLFVLGGLAKIDSPELYLDMMDGAGLAPARPLLTLVIALELGGGAWVASGARGHGPAALALAVHTCLINGVLHPFWQFDGSERIAEISFFFKNVSIVGGLLFVAGAARRDDPRGTRRSATDTASADVAASAREDTRPPGDHPAEEESR